MRISYFFLLWPVGDSDEFGRCNFTNDRRIRSLHYLCSRCACVATGYVLYCNRTGAGNGNHLCHASGAQRPAQSETAVQHPRLPTRILRSPPPRKPSCTMISDLARIESAVVPSLQGRLAVKRMACAERLS